MSVVLVCTASSFAASAPARAHAQSTEALAAPSATELPDRAASPDEEPAPPIPAPSPPARPRTPVAELWPLFVGTGVAALGLGLGLYFVPGPRPADPSIGVWRGGLLLDDGFRSALRAPTVAGENIAATASDYILIATMLNATAVDAITLPLLRDDPDLAWQASFAYSIAIGLELSLGGIVKDVSMRARPYEGECATNPTLPVCQSSTTYQSFFSLHSGAAFTSAGFSCFMHLERSLYDDQGADITACGASLLAASTVGVLRVVADAHYLSDVLVGGVTGFLLGYFIPMLVIPRARPRVRAADATDDPDAEPIAAPPTTSWSAAPMIDPGMGANGVTLGASVSGTF